ARLPRRRLTSATMHRARRRRLRAARGVESAAAKSARVLVGQAFRWRLAGEGGRSRPRYRMPPTGTKSASADAEDGRAAAANTKRTRNKPQSRLTSIGRLEVAANIRTTPTTNRRRRWPTKKSPSRSAGLRQLRRFLSCRLMQLAIRRTSPLAPASRGRNCPSTLRHHPSQALSAAKKYFASDSWHKSADAPGSRVWLQRPSAREVDPL